MAIKKKKLSANVPVSSMADIAFLLLVFFMVTSVLKVDADIPLNLPEGAGAQLDDQDIPVSIDKNRRIYFGNIPIATIQDLGPRIQGELALKPDARVLINAHDQLPVTVVEELFEVLKQVGANNVAIVTKQNERSL
jgi:biopolymer transport protein ExbD